MWSSRCPLLGTLFVAFVSACGLPPGDTFEPFVERMPGYASVWLTSDPVAPAAAVPVAMRSPDDPGILFTHTFVPGEPLRGSFATSEGRYQLSALGGVCAVDLVLGPSEEAEVLLQLNELGCSLTLERIVNLDQDPPPQRDEPSVLVTNHGVNETPFVAPVAPSP